jgi:Putative peptidoglycan binding domain
MRPLSLTRPLMHGPEVALWQRFLTSRGVYSGPINGTFDDRTSAATVEYQARSYIEADGLVGPATIERARRDGFVPPSSRPDREHFTTKGGVVLSSLDRTTLTQVAYDYYLWTGEGLTVTSGTRTPRSRAAAMFKKLTRGGISPHFYRNRQAYEEILAAYNAARKARANEQATVDAMTRVIDRQVSKGIYISLHLRGEAVDVRSRGM